MPAFVQVRTIIPVRFEKRPRSVPEKYYLWMNLTAREKEIAHLVTQGNPRAKVALELAESPNRFLATVQIGITLVGILAGAFGGATIAKEIAKVDQELAGPARVGAGRPPVSSHSSRTSAAGSN